MISLADLYGDREEEVTVAVDFYSNDVKDRGFACWRDICAQTIETADGFDVDRLNRFIKIRHSFEDFDDVGKKIVDAAVEIVSVCSTTDNLATSGPVDFDRLAGKVEAALPDNMKMDMLEEIVLAYRKGIERPERTEAEGECLGAIIDIDDNNRGDLIKIRMSIMKNGSGLFYPDPYAAFLKINDENFSSSLDNVARACGLVCWKPGSNRNAEPDNERNFDVRWSFLALNGDHFHDPNGIRGPSLGGAMYTLCRALMMDAGKSLPPETKEPQAARET